MKNEDPKPELPPVPQRREIRQLQPEQPREAPQREIMPERDPAPSIRPMEVPPGKENH